MRIFYSMLRPGYLRNFESSLRELASRGHEIHLAFSLKEKLNERPLLDALVADFPKITFSFMPKSSGHRWFYLTRFFRLYVDYLRYLRPEFADAEPLRARAVSRIPRFFALAHKLPGMRSRFCLDSIQRALLAIDARLPPDPNIAHAIRAVNPEIVLVTPLVDLGSSQVDVVKAANALGIPTMLWVASWDNLTNKGLIRLLPNRVAVWNEMQKREAVELHGVPEADVVVTGATAYDHWFEWRPASTKEEFLRIAGLQPQRPYFLYLCSSPFIAPKEVDFVISWIRALRSSGVQELRESGVLIRPHPQNAAQWAGVRFSPEENVAIYPINGENPVMRDSRATYFHSIYFSAAVVGLNTSGLIETAIIGRPVFSVLAQEFQGTMGNTLHFRHLTTVNGGLLHLAESLDDLCRQLGAQLAQPPGTWAEKSRRFVEGFVRPHGSEVSSAVLLADATEAAGRQKIPRHSGRGKGLAQAALWIPGAVAKFAYIAQKNRRKAAARSAAPVVDTVPARDEAR